MSKPKQIPFAGGLIRLEDYEVKQAGKQIPFVQAADEWEVCPAVGTSQLMKGDEQMLPAIILHTDAGLALGCTLSGASAMRVAGFLADYAGSVLSEASTDEVRELKASANSGLFDDAFRQVEEVVRQDMCFEATQIRERAFRKGETEGMAASKDLIRKLAMAASLPDASLKKEQLLEQVEPMVTKALSD